MTANLYVQNVAVTLNRECKWMNKFDLQSLSEVLPVLDLHSVDPALAKLWRAFYKIDFSLLDPWLRLSQT